MMFCLEKSSMCFSESDISLILKKWYIAYIVCKACFERDFVIWEKGHFIDLSKEYKFTYVPRGVCSEKNRFLTSAGVLIDQFRYIKIQPQTILIDLRTRLWGINPTNSVFIPQSLVLRSIVWGWILIYRNWSIVFPRKWSGAIEF